MTTLTEKEARRDIRLPLSKGIVFLRAPGLPSLACTLTNLSEHGCQCTAAFNALSESMAKDWHNHLQSGHKFLADISAPPHLRGVHVEAEVQHLNLIEDKVCIGLRFNITDDEERKLLNRALIALAAAHLSGTREALPPASGPQLSTAPREALLPASMSQLSAATQGRQYRGKKLGEILVEDGKINEIEAAEAEYATRSTPKRIGQYLLRYGYVSPVELCKALSLQSGLPVTELSEPPQFSPTALFSYLTMMRHRFIPFQQSEYIVSLAAMNALPPEVIKDLEQHSGRSIRLYLAEDEKVAQRLRELQPQQQRNSRKFPRYGLVVPLTFRLCDKRQGPAAKVLYEGQTVNLGEGGLMFHTRKNIHECGKCLELHFVLWPHAVEGVYSVRAIKEVEDQQTNEPLFAINLELLDMRPEERVKLKQICIQLDLRRQTKRKW